MDDYTDYHQYAWSALKPPTPPLVVLLHRLPGYIGVGLIVYFSYFTRAFQELDVQAKFFFGSIISLTTMGIIGVFHLVLNQIEKSRGPQLIQYRIDKQGIHCGEKVHPHSSKIALCYPDEDSRQQAEKALAHYLST